MGRWLAIAAGVGLAACDAPLKTPDYAVDEAQTELRSGRYRAELSIEATFAVAGAVVARSLCEDTADVYIAEDGTLSSSEFGCVFRDDDTEVMTLEGYAEAPWAEGELTGDDFWLDWEGGYMDEEAVFGVFSSSTESDGGVVTLEGWFEADWQVYVQAP